MSRRIVAAKRGDALWSRDRRGFLKTAVAAAAASAAACGSDNDRDGENDPPSDAVPPFVAGGTTYRVIDLVNYNGTLPGEGKDLAIVAYVKRDFFFRRFDASGTMVTNHHESRISDKTSLDALRGLVTVTAEKKVTNEAERKRFTYLFPLVEKSAQPAAGSATQSGRRLQGSQSPSGDTGRRLQGSTASGDVSARRMQGAEGRPESGGSPRNLGEVTINSQSYSDVRIQGTYTDGYTQIAHAKGTAVVRTDALPEIVRLQLPVEQLNPGLRPSATATETTTGTTTTVTPSEPAPRPRPPSSGGGSTRHYWRPN